MKETVITATELRGLPEYSCSLPTGATIGKRWRCDVTFNNPFDKDGQRRTKEWVIGEFVPHHDPDRIGINWAWAVVAPGVPHRGDPT